MQDRNTILLAGLLSAALSAIVCAVIVLPVISTYNANAKRGIDDNFNIAISQCDSGNLQRAQNYVLVAGQPEKDQIRTRDAFGIRNCPATVAAKGGKPVIIAPEQQDVFVRMLLAHPPGRLPIYRDGRVTYTTKLS